MSENYIYIGTSVGSCDIYSNWINSTSMTVRGLPSDGSTVYVRLFSRIDESWYYNDYTCNAWVTETVTTDLLEYFPPTQGSWWLYDVKYFMDDIMIWEGHEKIVHENCEKIHEVTVTKRVYYAQDHNNNLIYNNYSLFSYDAEYIYIHGYSLVGDEPVGLHDYGPPLAFKRFIDIGKSQTASTTVTHPDNSTESIASTIKLEGAEEVSVQAGFFPDCLKLEIAGSDGRIDIEWWAKGVGVVKKHESDSNENVWSLIELNGITPVRDSYEDVTAPASEIEDCEGLDTDSYEDLELKFDSQEVVDSLGDVDEVPLTLTGK